MTPIRASDALELVALIMERWTTFKPNLDQQRRYAQDLDGLDSDSARAAVESIYRAGRDFAPTAGEVRREAARLELGAPDWADVKRSLIERKRALDVHEPPAWVCPYDECFGDGWAVQERTVEQNPRSRACRCRAERRAARTLADTLHPLVREFIGEGYVSWAEVTRVGEARGDGPTVTLEAQMRNKWEAFASRAIESRAIASIEGGEQLRRLEQARAEDGPRRAPSRGNLQRPDFLAALPRGDGKAA